MTSYTLVISPVAQDDLKKIYQYSVSNRGTTRASSYLDQLKNHFWSLTEYPEVGIERDELLFSLRSFSVESHVIFYRINNRKIEIVRVLHGRQDPQLHIK